MKRRMLMLAGVLLASSALAVGVVAAVGSTQSSNVIDRQAAAQRLVRSGALRFMTWPAQAVVRMSAAGTRSLAPAQVQPGSATLARGGAAPPAAGFTNVRANDPAADSHQSDQTTQSEPSLAAAGS